jgi:hypothetical protein
MQGVIINALIDYGIYSLFVLIYTLVGAYQNINIWGMSFNWKIYVNGLVKWLALGASVVGATFGAFLLLAQAEAQGISIVNAQAVAPRVILGVVILASAVMLGKIISKLATTMGVPADELKKLQEQSVNTDADKPLIVNVADLPQPSEDYIKAKLQDEKEGGVGTYYSIPTGSYDQLRNTVLGNGYDVDNYYGWQCWDGTALLWQQLGRSLVTGNGLAIGCWDLKRDVNAGGDFDLITDVNSLQRGDVVCMRPNHIGFFDGYDGNYMVILGQNQGGSPTNPAGGSAFNLARISKSAFAGAFRFKKWAVAPAPTPAPARKSNEEIAKEVLRGDWGNGDVRKARLASAGYDYNAIQAIVNGASPAPAPARKSNDEIALEVRRGDWGNGADRKARLEQAGYDYNAIQAIVNKSVPEGGSPSATFAVGDRVAPLKPVAYNGLPLTQYDNAYTITEINGDRAVLSARGQVWSAVRTSNLKKV